MPTATLNRRATTFALCAAGVTFFLALLITANGGLGHGDFLLVFAPAIVCAALAWASAQHGVVETASAIDEAVTRLAEAANGDLTARVPAATHDRVPALASAMETLFAQLAENLHRVERLALFDTVTGLANRSSFRSSAEAMLAALPPRWSAALFFIDLDRFKSVNDNRGHACGDQLLAQVAVRLSAVTAGAVPPPLLGRLAGDEFTILWPKLGDPAAIERVGARITASLGAPFELPGGPVSIGASIGVAVRPGHGTALHELMRAADAAMYRSKADGRGRLTRFDDGLAAEIERCEQLDRELHAALAEEQLVLFYQPQLRLQSGALAAAEALLRWRHPVSGLQLPAAFLARAEQNGQIVAIGEWIVRAVAASAAEWDRVARPGRLALNVSARQLEHVDFVASVAAAFEQARAPLTRLEIEIGEGPAMRCPPEVAAQLAALRAAGATIALDDFGTGQLSVQRLRAFPVDRVKLDPSLLRDIADDAGARAILQAMIGLVHGIGCEVVAEGVESAAQLDVLRVLGCDAVQGFAIARPMELDGLARWCGARTGGADQAVPSARQITSA